MHILNRRLHHEWEPQDQDKPAITIPFSTLREAIMLHQDQEMRRSLNKRRYDDKDDEVQEGLLKSLSQRKKMRPT